MNTQVLECLRESARWRMIGLLLECPTSDWQNQVRQLSQEVDDEDLAAAARHSVDEASPELYYTFFGPGGPAAPREVTYRDSTLPGQIMGELNAYYRAFAYQSSTSEPPDHISVEIGFIGYMYLKEAYAHARGDSEGASITADARHHFIADHLEAMAQALSTSLAGSGVAYLIETAKALRDALQSELAQWESDELSVASGGQSLG